MKTPSQADPVRHSILFLCVHNAGRSQMGAAFAEKLGGDSVVVYSGGSEPAASLNPTVVLAMAELGIDLGARVPRRFDLAMVEAAQVVITMGCGDECPYVPGKRYLDWELDDPKGQSLDIVRRIRDEIRGRVVDLLGELGVNVTSSDR